MENSKTIPKTRSFYQKIFGIHDDSFYGPLFFFTVGIICLIISVLIMMGPIETFVPGTLGEYPSNSARPDISFPFLGMLTLFFISAGVVGFFLGGMGL